MKYRQRFDDRPTEEEIGEVLAEVREGGATVYSWVCTPIYGEWLLEVRGEDDGARWRRNRKSHRWVTLDGENFSCDYCDTKTGSEPCPGGAI